MTKRDYELFARLIADAEREGAPLITLACRLADAFYKDNPRFDRTRFLKACNPRNQEEHK